MDAYERTLCHACCNGFIVKQSLGFKTPLTYMDIGNTSFVGNKNLSQNLPVHLSSALACLAIHSFNELTSARFLLVSLNDYYVNYLTV